MSYANNLKILKALYEENDGDCFEFEGGSDKREEAQESEDNSDFQR